ncbi:MAG: hypothetical protein AB7Y46_03610 [Armatimonadota bacterium]
MPERAKCPKCGAEVFASDDVCMDCGADLVAARQERSQRPAPAADEPQPRREPRAGPQAEPAPAWRWLWVPPMRGASRYPILRTYQYICVAGAWISLLGAIAGALFEVFGWLTMRSSVPPVPAELDLLAVALAAGLTVAVGVFWAFTLRATVEGIQVFLDIEENTRRSAEAAEASHAGDEAAA